MKKSPSPRTWRRHSICRSRRGRRPTPPVVAEKRHAEGMDQRLTVAPVVPRFAAAIREVAGVTAFYAGGSIGSGDYRPGISDLDLVAVLGAPLTRARRDRLSTMHRTLGVAKLHCAYVPSSDIS